MLNLIAASVCWFTLGAMIVFGAVVAPTVFKVLSPDSAGAFLRTLFPRLYLFCGITTLGAGVLLAVALRFWDAASIGIISSLFFISRGPLTRRINAVRDQELANVEGAKEHFEKLHKLSVRIFGLQALVLLFYGVFLQTL